MPDLEAGASLQRSSEKRINELTHLSAQGELLPAYPIHCRDGKEVSLLRLLPDYEYHGKYTIKIKFRPIWNRTFTLCSSRKDTIIALVIELNEDDSEERTKQYWIDTQGVREAKLTTKGNGCDPKVIEASETILADILIESHNNNVVREAAQFLKERYK